MGKDFEFSFFNTKIKEFIGRVKKNNNQQYPLFTGIGASL